MNASGLGGMTLNTAGVNATTGDFDNDEDVDIYVVSATFTGNPSNVIYENQGNGTFVAIPHAGGAGGTRLGQGDSVSTVDYDLDGYLDVFITNGGEWSPQGRRILDEGPNELFRNTGSGNHWLLIDLEGVHANRDGIGSRLELTAGGRTQLREQNNGIHARTQNHQRIHFGLGQNEIVDKLKVFWPNGTSQTLATIQSDQLITITEGVGFDGADRIIGTTISETFLGGDGNDTLNGRSGNDTLSGESGRDRLLGESGEDYLTGGAGRDTLLGGANNDTLLGQSDHDLLKGLAGNDNLSGGAGNDTLIGGPGQDRLRGGVGRDRFTFEYLNQGVDRILDFNVNQDLIELDGSRFPGNLELGQLLDSAFQLGSSAVSGQDRVIYDQNTGSLFFDPDGDGAQSQRLLLVLTNRSDLSARNIRII